MPNLKKRHNDPIPNPTPVDIVGCRPFRYSGLNLKRIGTYLDESNPNNPTWMHLIKDLDSGEVKEKDFNWLKIVCEKVVSLRKDESN